MPGIAITSDVIVGFPGETDNDFAETLDLVRKAEFDSLFTFEYSDRTNVPAAHFSGKIPDKEKNERLRILLELQEYYNTRKNQALVGKTEVILVEGFSKKQGIEDGQEGFADIHWTGRTSTNKIVNFVDVNTLSGDDNLMGNRIDVMIEKAFSHSLWGRPVNVRPMPLRVKGEESYAA